MNLLFHIFFKMILIAVLLSGCTSLFYYPTPHKHYYKPEQVPLAYENIYFGVSTQNRLHGWFFPAQKQPALGTVVFFHGNAENISTHFLMLHWLPASGYNYFIFDYPGYGLSAGQPNPENTVAAGIQALKWVHSNKDSAPLIIYGHSLGGIVALKTLEDNQNTIPIRDVIIEGSFDSYQRMGRLVLQKSWLTWIFQPLAWILVSDAYAPQNIAQLSPVPLLVIHGDQDNVIPLKTSKILYNQAQEPKQLWIIDGGGHGNTYFLNKGSYRQKLLEYLARSK